MVLTITNSDDNTLIFIVWRKLQMNVIKKVANAHGVSEKEVREEMLMAIRAGRENLDPNVQAMWNRLFPDGKEPTPEEFIKVIAEILQTEGGC